VLEHAVRSAELSEAVESIVSSRLSNVSGTLRLSAPPSISDTLLTPSSHRVFRLLTPMFEFIPWLRTAFVDHIFEGRGSGVPAGTFERLVTRRKSDPDIPASARGKPGLHEGFASRPKKPRDLLDHRLLSFSYWKSDSRWTFVHKNGKDKETLTFSAAPRNERLRRPYARVAGRAAASANFRRVVQPDLVRKGRLVEVMPDWHFSDFRPLTRSSGKQTHFTIMSVVQGICDADGAYAIPGASNLKEMWK